MPFLLFMSVMIVCHNLLNTTLKFVKNQTNDGHLTGHYSKKFNSLEPIRDDLIFVVQQKQHQYNRSFKLTLLRFCHDIINFYDEICVSVNHFWFDSSKC